MITLFITSTPERFIPVFTHADKRQSPEFITEIISIKLRNLLVGIKVTLSEVEFPECKSLSWLEESDDPFEYSSESLFVVNANDVLKQVRSELRPKIRHVIEANGYIYPSGSVGQRFCWIFSTRYCKLVDEELVK